MSAFQAAAVHAGGEGTGALPEGGEGEVGWRCGRAGKTGLGKGEGEGFGGTAALVLVW